MSTPPSSWAVHALTPNAWMSRSRRIGDQPRAPSSAAMLVDWYEGWAMRATLVGSYAALRPGTRRVHAVAGRWWGQPVARRPSMPETLTRPVPSLALPLDEEATPLARSLLVVANETLADPALITAVD